MCLEDAIKKVKRQPTEWEKYLKILSLRNDLYQAYIENSYNLTIKRQPKIKMYKDMNRSTNGYKGAQHHKSLEKCDQNHNKTPHSLEARVKKVYIKC